MQKYKVISRKYRPQNFRDVVGQEAIVKTLKNAILSSNIAQAYLFCGSQGIGKTTLTRLFAKALNCQHPQETGEPCNQCLSCKEIAEGSALDVYEIDGASHRGIEDIRQINEAIGFSPSTGHYKIYIIDEVHMLTKEAFNALLKTLEEPPPEIKFFFATTEPHKIPTTIVSRCQQFHLKRISLEEIVKKLSTITHDLKVPAHPEALHLIAQFAEGGLRDAESLLDQVITFQKHQISLESVREMLGLLPQETFFRLDRAGAEGNWVVAFEVAAQLFSSGKNVTYFIEELMHHFRKLLLIKTKSSLLPLSKEEEQKYHASAAIYHTHQLLNVLDFIYDAQKTIRSSPSQQITLEMLLLHILQTHKKISIETLLQRLLELEKRLEEKPHKQVNVKKSPPPEAPLKGVKLSPPSPPPEKGTLVSDRQSHYDTVMQFAAKELNGRLKKNH